ncbi:Y8948 methyltransferase, partial [Polyodon spathula]|nr:putative methyltransferase DDB_G0268948 [Polyodon spathula]XP_041118435.1 putative methyltransferase DDB_G0268948 [Polyodon spathula]XP_041118436.1 putative methyltransferase DDB_G0268948 [Polyodon spathula]XP_041118437.1 putative methyltransferase DDB_G0268948 [Polyodon spathula]MBN3277734.1 Y8948 methyltransferase [Polyodon spathula]
MSFRLFEGKEHADIYQKYRFDPPDEVKSVILNYLDKKKGRPHVLAVDLGCGTGQNTRVLAPHFQKVVGIDVSEAQLAVATRVAGFPNISYRAGPAEDLPFEDGSVDLVTAASAAHWFNADAFLKEAERVLKPRGCIALLGYSTTTCELHCKDGTGDLTEILTELWDCLKPYGTKQWDISNSMLQEIFEAIRFPEKERVENIAVKTPLSVCDFLGYIQSISMYQSYSKADPEAATTMIQRIQRRLLEEMGVSAETELEIWHQYFCVLASKPE